MAALALLAASALAPPFAAAEGLTLQQVIDATLEHNVAAQLARREVGVGEGELLVSRSVFDPLLSAATGAALLREPDGAATLRSTVGSLSLRLAQQFRSGLTLAPEVEWMQTDLDGVSMPALSTAEARVALIVPLLRDRFGLGLRAREEAAAAGLEGDRWALEHQVALSLLEAAVAYWDYVAGYRQLSVLTISEQRAETLESETQALVEADERPVADLNQVRGNVASKRISRIAAERAILSSRTLLGIVMGIPAAEIAALPEPADDFPDTEPFRADRATIERLIASAIRSRADLAAAVEREQAASRLAEAARNELRARLDLSLSAGYLGLELDDGLGPFLGSLGADGGATALAQLRYELPARNRLARGNLLQSESFYEQRSIARRDLARSIEAAIAFAAEELELSAAQAAEARRAVELNRETLDNEKEKNRLGLATLFDVILAEDRLTADLLSEVTARLSYAAALATLRFEAGTLLEEPDPAALDAARLLEPP